jgi:MGT family glycosyltransferase
LHRTFRSAIEKTGAIFKNYPDAIPSAKTLSEKAHNLVNFSLLLLGASQTLTPFAIQEIEKEIPDLVIYDTLNLWARIATRVTHTQSIATFSIAILEGVRGLFDARTLLFLLVTALPKIPKLLWYRAKLGHQYGKDAVQFPLFPSTGQLNLVFLAREFQMDTAFIDNSFKFVGASINHDLRTETPLDLSNIAKPLVYVSLGTVNNTNLQFYKEALRAFKDYPAQFILSIGNYLDIDDLQPIPENSLVMSSVPQLQILQHADIFVTHGGMNSIQEALYYGVPLIVVPQQMEQMINGQRIVDLGAGIVLGDKPPFGRVTAQALHTAVNDMLANPSYRQRANNQRQLSHDSGGYIKAVDEIEAFITLNQPTK